jgi:large subunit ribosomal protein L24
MASQRTPKFKLKRGDLVKAIAGEDAASGKTGKVLRVDPASQRALVEGFNLVKKHIKRSQDYPQGGIVEKEAPIHVSNLKVVTPAGRE